MHYRLDWVWDDAVKIPGGWEVSNDRGYRVRVRRGYLTSYSMELVECPKTPAVSPVANLGASLWSFVEGAAYAGHATGTPNPAAIHPMQVESLTAPAAVEVGMVRLLPQAYCKLHYLVAGAGRGAPGLPADVDMLGVSLHVDGTYRAPGSSADVPFSIHTGSANGALFEHTVGSHAAIHLDVGRTGAIVTVRRHLGSLFDGVDFAAMNDRRVAGQVLQSIVDNAELEIQESVVGDFEMKRGQLRSTTTPLS